MSFDFSTLITDRTQDDVTNKTSKGFYNASDLNRVTSCMEYLDEELRKLGYESGYKPVLIERAETPSQPVSRLPEGYTELEYIESTGAQYIDTKIPPSPTVVLRANINIVSLPQNAWILCSRIANGQGQFGILAQSGSNALRVDYGQTTTNLQIPKIVGPLSIELGADRVDINGVTHSFSHQTFTSSYPIAVLAGNSGGTVSGWCNARLESLTLSDGDTAKFNGIPCKNPSGKVGLYDLVSGQFFGSAGTGGFVAGPELSNTLLLLHGEDISDSSLYNVKITNEGAQVSTAQSKFGGSSLYFDGSSRLLIPQSAIPFKSGDFTIDWWEYAEEGATCRFVSAYSEKDRYGGVQIGWGGTTLTMSDSVDSVWDLNAGNAFDVTPGAWVHWALVRKGGSIKTYKNGVQKYSGSLSVPIAYDEKYMAAIGSDRQDQPEGSNFKGYIDEFRISNVARWTADFTPPDRPYEVYKQEQQETEPLDPYTWYASDAPTASQMDQYLANVASIRSVFILPDDAPQTPKSMALLTFAKANDIESVLQIVKNVIERVRGSLDLGWALGIAHIGIYGGV